MFSTLAASLSEYSFSRSEFIDPTMYWDFLYPAIRCSDRLIEAGVEASVGSVGDAYDNAMAETVNGLYKTELIHKRGTWRSLEAVEYATLEWVHWFNNIRLLEPIGYVPPAELENAYYTGLGDLSEVAELR